MVSLGPLSPRHASTLLVVLLLLFSVETAHAKKNYLTITSNPPGATVEIDGVPMGKTPLQIEIPGGYLHGTRSVFGKRLATRSHVRLKLEGYLPVESDLARGPYPFITLNGVYHGDYFILKTDTFNFALEKAATTFTGTVEARLGDSSSAVALLPELPVEEVVRRSNDAVLWLKGSEGSGSGFLISKTGIAVTNAHVAKGQSDLVASTGNGQNFKAKVIYIDSALDLAFVKVEGSDLPHLALADIGSVHTGSNVLAIGTPSKGFQNTVTKGIVSGIGAMSQESGTWIQTDAAINPGNSGGPLLNSQGAVIGITTQKQFVSGDGRPLQGIGFALSSNDVLRVVRQFYPDVTLSTPGAPAPNNSGKAKVTVIADLDSAEIYVDGKFVGSTPSTLTLTSGTHKLEVKSPSGKPWTKDLEVMPDSDVKIKALLSVNN